MECLGLNMWPCHPRGSWQRALAHQAAGLPVDDVDAAALAVWDRHAERPPLPKRAYETPR